MNASLVRRAVVVGLLMTGRCGAQQLQIVRPDDSVFESISIGKLIVVELPTGSNPPNATRVN